MGAKRYAGKRLREGRVSEPGRIYLITTVTQGREPVFEDLYLARRAVRLLYRPNDAASTLAYVLMPDHLHWLVQLEQGDLSKVVGGYKSACAKAVGRPIWQRGFHDRAARREDDLRAMARYMVANPLRAGIVEQIGDFPHWDAVWL